MIKSGPWVTKITKLNDLRLFIETENKELTKTHAAPLGD